MESRCRARVRRAFQRARFMTSRFSSAFISPYRTLTSVTPARPWTFDSTSLRIWTRRGHPAVVSATSIVTRPSLVISMSRTIPRSTMLACNSGSITPSSMRRTAATLGRGPSACNWDSGSFGFTLVSIGCPFRVMTGIRWIKPVSLENMPTWGYGQACDGPADLESAG